MAALQHLSKIDTQAEPGPVVVTVFDQDRIADYQKMVAALRNAGIRAELYLGSGKFGAQMKYADKRGAPCVVIQGGDEKAKGEVQIKDLILGATISSIKDRDEYLKKQAEAQFAVPEEASWSRRCARCWRVIAEGLDFRPSRDFASKTVVLKRLNAVAWKAAAPRRMAQKRQASPPPIGEPAH